jgi:hypothetical protein
MLSTGSGDLHLQYREAVLSEELEALHGRAREYASAFGLANDLIERAASDVFGQLAAYRGSTSVSAPEELEFHGTQQVTFVLRDAPILNAGILLNVDDPLLPDALQIVHLTIAFDRGAGLSQRVTGEILTGSGDMRVRR